ncbi:CASP family protein [Schizosaccharomyces japonicus yFS275]|uniref:Protein CASP n=1 Tax=Schizosaccharomyces japonicus (strain yFS275 / FY16936) TaxID=402676 RepID=B6K251_SCHJY|nr:CASP family protein [Schizosaccharomyces japonicus yFS275]EEB07232.1 CASP family protein [Schizosaccharomyces japonicus yFS275]
MQESVLLSAKESWKNANFTELQREMDSVAIELANVQKNSLEERKEIASKTKDFRKLEDDQKLLEIKALLKRYQTGIDSLTRRAKNSEALFAKVYEALGDVPDPFPILESLSDYNSTQDELESIRSKYAASQVELSQAKDAQKELEALKQQMRKQAEQYEAKIRKAVKDTRKECESEYAKQEAMHKDAEAEAAHQIEELKQKLQTVQLSQIEQSIQLSQKSDASESKLTSMEGFNTLMTDLEKASQKIAKLQQENEELKQRSAIAQDSNADAESSSRVHFLETENDELTQRLHEQLQHNEKAKAEYGAELEKITSLLQEQEASIQELQAQVNQCADYEEVKRELQVFKEVEFGTEESKNEKSAEPLSLEARLMQKERRMASELATYRQQAAELQMKCAQYSSRVEQLEEKSSRHKKIIEELENELRSVDVESGSVVNFAHSQYGRSSPTSTILNGGNTSIISGHTMSVTGNAESTVGIMDIIKKQRDRFRNSNMELLKQVNSLQSENSKLQEEIEEMKRTTTSLYEQARYKASYRQYMNPSDLELGNANQSYETKISPYSNFRSKEMERAYSRMGPLERVVYSLVKLVLLNKATRLMFLSYLLGLHVVTMLSLANSFSA